MTSWKLRGPEWIGLVLDASWLQGGLAAAVGAMLVTTLALALAWRLRGAASRHAVLLGALMSCLLAPLLASTMSGSRWSWLTWRLPSATARTNWVSAPAPHDHDNEPADSTATSAGEQAAATPALDAIAPTLRDGASSVHSSTVAAPPPSESMFASRWSSGLRLPHIVAAVWWSGATLLLAGALRASARAAALRRRARPLGGRASAIREAQRRLLPSHVEAPRPLQVLVSSELASPVAVGLLRAAIVVPDRLANALDDEELTQVLVHEAAHVRRCDLWARHAQALARALYWPLPTFHRMSRELDAAREELCDNQVLRDTESLAYCRTLLKVAEWAQGRSAPALAVGMLRGPSFEARVAGLLASNRDRSLRAPRGRSWSMAVLLAALGAIVGAVRLTADDPPAASSPAPDDESRRAFTAPVAAPPPNEDVPAPPQPAPAASWFQLPLDRQICESHPPRWARRDEQLGGGGGRLLWLDNDRLLWGGAIIAGAGAEPLGKFPFDGDASVYPRRISVDRKFLLVSRTDRFDPGFTGRPATWLEVWDVAGQRRVGGKIGPLDVWGESDADVSRDGQSVVVASREGIRVWQTADNSQRALPVDLEQFPRGYEGRAPWFTPEYVRFSPDGTQVIAFSPNNLVVWRWQADEPHRVVPLGRRLGEFAFAHQGKWLVEGPDPRADIEIRDLETLEVVRRLSDEGTRSFATRHALAVTPDGRTLFAGNSLMVDETKVPVPHRLIAWDLESGEVRLRLATPHTHPSEMDLSPDGRRLAVHYSFHYQVDGKWAEGGAVAVWELEQLGL